MSMRKATSVGINNYPGAPLQACIKDATDVGELLKTNGDDLRNFDVKTYTDVGDKGALTEIMLNAFKGDHEIALFYFSGHGALDELDGYLVTPDYKKYDIGVSINTLLKIANDSKCRNKVIILDCCHSGFAGSSNVIGSNVAIISSGVTILTASKSDETALEVNGHGVFTNLLIEALKGGAADISGNITPGGVYAYIDQALGAHDQRPVFKTNITEFTPLRRVNPQVPKEVIQKIIDLFPDPKAEFKLDPSYEETNREDEKHLFLEPYAQPEHVSIFKILQQYQGVGLVVPVEAKYMYYAAMESKSCKLTPLGHHYWGLAKKGRIK
jgi:Caspase domain